jgi:hypothetical protein
MHGRVVQAGDALERGTREANSTRDPRCTQQGSNNGDGMQARRQAKRQRRTYDQSCC